MPILRQRFSTKEKDASASRRILLIIALCLFVVALSLVILQSVPGMKLVKTYSDGYKEGFTKARMMAAEQNPSIQMPMSALNGTVKAVSTDSVSIEAANTFVDKNVDGTGMTRTISVNSQTKIVKDVYLTPDEFQKQVESFQEAMKTFNPKNGTVQPTSPSPFKEVEAKLSDITVGTSVVAYPSKEITDVRTLSSFQASKIVILVQVDH
jgi:hypothetical protein